MWPGITQLVAPRRAPHRQYVRVPDARPGPPWGLYRGEPETCRRRLRRFLPIVAHLGLLLAIFKVYRVEGRAFQLLVSLALAALPVHYALPFRWKKPFFVAASVLGLAWVFGAAVAAVVLPLAAVLIGACVLPLPWRARAAVVAAVALALGLARAGLGALAVPDGVWPVLGSMFMFRMILYLYELKHAEGPESLVDALSYFVLLPNYCFLHFPVVDYRTFRRGYFAADIHAIQRTGLDLMVRGTVHLLLFRFVYHELLIPADAVRDPASLACFLACNYLLYLRVSAPTCFHIAPCEVRRVAPQVR